MLGPVMRRLGLLAVIAACGSHPRHAPSGTAHDKTAVEVSLYRDHAVISHRIQVAIPTAATATVHLRIAAGVEPDDIYIVEKSDLVVREIRKATDGRPSPKSDGCDEVSCVLDDYEPVCCARFKRKKSQWGDDEDGERPAPPPTKSAAPMDDPSKNIGL